MESENSSVKQVNEPPKDNYIWTKLNLLRSIVIQSQLGQTVLRLADNFLWTVEKCMEWSLPSEESFEDINGKVKKVEHVRPLPWILFLPSLIMLRMTRILLNIVILLLGFSLITPSDMVRLIQKIRGHLIVLKSSGMKERHCSKDKRSSINKAKQALIRSIRLTLSSLSCLDAGSKSSPSPPPTRIHVSSALDLDTATTTSEEKSVTESMDSIKRRDSTDSSEGDEEKERTLQEQLDQLTSSDNDSEYMYSSTGRDNLSLLDDSRYLDTSVSSSELNDIIEDTKKWRKVEAENLEPEQVAAITVQAATPEQKSPMIELNDYNSEEEDLRRLRCFLADEYFPTSNLSSQEGEPIFFSPFSSDSDTPKERPKLSAPTAEKSVSADSRLKTAEFINGEIRSCSASAVSESPEKANNGAVVEKRGAGASKCHKGKRASHGNRRKK